MSDELMNIIIQRLNHQDKTLDEIRRSQGALTGRLDTHMALEAQVKPSIDELISVLNGSKILGRVVIWGCSLIGAAWAFVVWARGHINL